MPTPILVNPKKAKAAYAKDAFQAHAWLVLSAAGLIFLLGTLLDFVILWGFQRQAVPQWEFTALASTAEGLPRLILALALIYAAMHARGSTSLLGYRFLALGLIFIGLAGAAIGALMVTDYFALRAMVNPEAISILQSTTIKTLALCTLYVFVLLPVGIVGMRRPKTA
ncbi:MAG: hypothetical protein ACREMQ_06925 [Longimicrobiales bacterium]